MKTNFSWLLDIAMREQYLGVADIGKITGVSRQTIYSWLKGDVEPQLDRALIVFAKLGIPMSLLKLKDPK